MFAIDYAGGPYLQFPILYLIPVGLAAWYSGRNWAIVLALAMPLARALFHLAWVVPYTIVEISINAVVRIVVLSVFAYFVDRTGRQTRRLTQEVRVLQGLLPICSFCKRIRATDETWVQLERYISDHSEAMFSHGLCPDCLEQHYGAFAARREGS